MDYNERPKLSWAVFKELAKSSKRMALLIWREKRGLAIAFGFIILILSAAPFLLSGSRGLLINGLVEDAGLGALSSETLVVLVLMIVAMFIHPIFSSLQFYFDRRFWLELEIKFETELAQKLGEIDIATHEDPKKANLFNRVRETGLWRIQNFNSRQFFIIQNIIEVLIASAILIVADWRILALIVLATLPELFTEAKYGNATWGIWSQKAEERRRFWSYREYFSRVPSLTELKLFQNVGHFISLMKQLLGSFQNAQKVVERRKLWQQIGTLALGQGAIIFATIWFVFSVIRGELQIGTFTFFLASMGDLRQSLSAFFSNLGRQYQDGLFVADVFRVLDMPQELLKPKQGKVLPKEKTPSIVFENISFQYPGSKQFVLKDFSLTIPPGEKIAIVGANGAGKTTLVKLLCRFYDPTAGRILIDGTDLRELDIESWYYQLGAIFQDYNQYHLLVRDSIGLGRTSLPQSQPHIESAAQSAEADVFIQEWEHAYGQQLGKQFDEGVEPSIGQWQKLALARTFYRDPRILILDEPTASVDAEAEAKIFAKLEQLPSDRTVFLISHRFSTVRQANRICVIKDGKLAELGSHQDLLAQEGIYARLFRLQAKGYQ